MNSSFVGAIAAMAIPQHGRFAVAGAGPAPTGNPRIARVLRDLWNLLHLITDAPKDSWRINIDGEVVTVVAFKNE